MSEYPCHVSPCSRKAVAICMCRSPPFLACEVHAHFGENQVRHKCLNIYSEISSSVEGNLLSLCISYENQVTKTIELATTTCASLLIKIKQNYQNLINELTELRKKIRNVRMMNKRSQRISVLDDATEAEQTISRLIKNPSAKICEWEKYRRFLNEDQARTALLANFNEQNDEYNIISIQRPHTKKLIKLNVINRSVTEAEIPIAQNFPYACGWCKINNDFLLIHGGAKEFNTQAKIFTMSECTYLINTSFNTLAHLTIGPKKSDLGNGTLYKGEIYFFGGFKKSSTVQNSVHKFVLSSREWENATNLPQPMGYCTSALAESYIYVSGSPSTGVFQFNPIQDYYILIANDLEESYKTIFFFNRKLFVVFDNKLRFFDESNTPIDQDIDISNMFMLGHSTCYKNNLYFILGMYNNKTGKYTSSKLCKIDGQTNLFTVITNGVLSD